MNTAKVFVNGRSQAVRIPKEYRFNTDEVFVNKVGDVLILTPKDKLVSSFEKGVNMFTDDFLADGIPGSIDSEREEI